MSNKVGVEHQPVPFWNMRVLSKKCLDLVVFVFEGYESFAQKCLDLLVWW